MLTIKEFRQRVFDEIQNAEQWIKEKCEGYEEVIICSDHYPFGTDCPVCLWIQRTPRLKHYQVYSADWDLFDVEKLPNNIVSRLENREVNAFEYVKDKFTDKSCVRGGCSIFDLLNNQFSYMMDDCSYNEYLEYSEEEGKDIEAAKAIYNMTDFSRTVDDNDYSGSLYLNLYVVARK